MDTQTVWRVLYNTPPLVGYKNDKRVVLAKILFLTIVPIYGTLKSIGGADFQPQIFFKLDCHHMYVFVIFMR